jgi:hypothetical protein
MLKRLVTVFAVAAALAVPTSASAAKDAPGVPGEKNCKGQTTAFLAQAGQDFDVPGLGNLARFAGLTVQEVHAIVDAYCG